MDSDNFKSWITAIIQGVIGNIIILALTAIGLLTFNIQTAQIIIAITAVFLLLSFNWAFLRAHLSRLPAWIPLPFERDIFWDFSDHFLGMSGCLDGNFVHAFQAQGYNRSKRSIRDFRGYIESEITGERFPILFNINGSFHSPVETHGIPPQCNFQISAPFTLSGEYAAFRMPLVEFKKNGFHFWWLLNAKIENILKDFIKTKLVNY